LSNWIWEQFFTYVLLSEGADQQALEAKFSPFLDRFADPSTSTRGFTYEAQLQPLTDIHLRSAYLTFDWGIRGNILYVYTFSAIALFVLLIACFNFMNLSTARATKRAREVGMRKVIGARRVQLIVQFLGEATLMAFVALLAALAITQITLPSFNDFTGKDLAISYTSGWVVPALLLLSVALGIVAGSYPALYLSAFRPVRVLKGGTGAGGPGLTSLRRALVVAQFVITITLIISTVVVYRQLQFVRTADLGFERDLLVKLPLRDEMFSNVDAIRSELLRHPSVASVTASWGTPGGFAAGDGIHLPGRDAEFGIRVFTTDYEFVRTFDMRMAAGRDFSREHPSDEHEAFLLNEAAARALGWSTEEAVGREISWDMWAIEGTKRGSVIGVVEDFHFSSLREAVEPVVITIHPVYGHFSVRLRPGGTASALEMLEAEWKKWAPAWPFEYEFLEDELAEQYESEDRLARICAVFAALAILIACLGLFGLTSFMVERRTKEIGIRKVMGASVKRLVLLLSRDFALLVLVAFAVAVPIAFLAARAWLDGFAYRVDVEPEVFILAGSVSFAIAVATVSFHTIRAAMSDPVKSLRYE
ncbi:MAG: FtsX-like permease family protein, partial [Rhodothermales bacterium]